MEEKPIGPFLYWSLRGLKAGIFPSQPDREAWVARGLARFHELYSKASFEELGRECERLGLDTGGNGTFRIMQILEAEGYLPKPWP